VWPVHAVLQVVSAGSETHLYTFRMTEVANLATGPLHGTAIAGGPRIYSDGRLWLEISEQF